MAVTSANAKIASTGYVDEVAQTKADAAKTAANSYTDQKIGALNATTTGDGVFVTNVTQTDGVVTVTKGNIDYSSLADKPTVDTEMKADSTNAVQNKVIKSYVDTEVGKKQASLTTEQLAAVNSGITTDKVTAITQNTTDIAAITSATIAENGNEDGQYVLTKKVVDGVITYSWELIDRAPAN